MVNFKPGDRVVLMDPYVWVSWDHFSYRGEKREINKRGASGTVKKVDPHGNVKVVWDEPYKGRTDSGFRRQRRFGRMETGPW